MNLLLPGASVGSLGISAQASQHLSWVGTCWDKETEVSRELISWVEVLQPCRTSRLRALASQPWRLPAPLLFYFS